MLLGLPHHRGHAFVFGRATAAITPAFSDCLCHAATTTGATQDQFPNHKTPSVTANTIAAQKSIADKGTSSGSGGFSANTMTVSLILASDLDRFIDARKKSQAPELQDARDVQEP